MNLLTQLSIGKKNAIITWVSVISFIILLLVVGRNISHSSDNLGQIQHDLYPALQQLQGMSVTTDQLVEALRTAVMVGELDMLENTDQLYQKWQDYANTLIQLRPEHQALVAPMQRYYQAARGIAEGMIEGTVDFAQLGSQTERVNQQLQALQQQLQTATKQADLAVDAAVAKVHSNNRNTLTISSTIGVATVIAILLIGWAVTQNITSGVRGVSTSLREFATGEGDLTARLRYQGKDELGELVGYFNQFIANLQRIIQQTISSTEEIQQMAEKLSQVTATNNKNVAQRNHAIVQTSEALHEMFESVGHISENAAQANQSAQTASGDCRNGRELMHTNVATINQLAQDVEHTATEMARLESHTNNVGNIIETIRSIADQTNLLALNAAIEAARAGEHGRGFAVVADEVRNLASRTQTSTEEIHVVLEELQTATQSAVSAMNHGIEKTAESVAQAQHTGDALDSISERVAGISEVNELIAAATEQQHIHSNQISDHIEQLGHMAEQSSQHSGELDEVSQALLRLNQQLFGQVSRFKV